jgi:hypothetical protein
MEYRCGKVIEITISTKFSCRLVQVRCGSTSIHGGVNQCDDCSKRTGHIPLPDEDEGDLEYDHRINHGDK